MRELYNLAFFIRKELFGAKKKLLLPIGKASFDGEAVSVTRRLQVSGSRTRTALLGFQC